MVLLGRRIGLEVVMRRDFVPGVGLGRSGFAAETGKLPFGEFEILAAPCAVRIALAESGRVEADVFSVDPALRRPTSEENREVLFLTFVNGGWEATDPFEA